MPRVSKRTLQVPKFLKNYKKIILIVLVLVLVVAMIYYSRGKKESYTGQNTQTQMELTMTDHPTGYICQRPRDGGDCVRCGSSVSCLVCGNNKVMIDGKCEHERHCPVNTIGENSESGVNRQCIDCPLGEDGQPMEKVLRRVKAHNDSGEIPEGGEVYAFNRIGSIRARQEEYSEIQPEGSRPAVIYYEGHAGCRERCPLGYVREGDIASEALGLTGTGEGHPISSFAPGGILDNDGRCIIDPRIVDTRSETPTINDNELDSAVVANATERVSQQPTIRRCERGVRFPLTNNTNYEACIDRPIDIVFIVDRSGSITSAQEIYCKSLIQQLIFLFNTNNKMSPGTSDRKFLDDSMNEIINRVSIITYSQQVRVVMNDIHNPIDETITEYDYYNNILDNLWSVDGYEDRSTHTHRSLQELNKLSMYTRKNNIRNLYIEPPLLQQWFDIDESNESRELPFPTSSNNNLQLVIHLYGGDDTSNPISINNKLNTLKERVNINNFKYFIIGILPESQQQQSFLESVVTEFSVLGDSLSIVGFDQSELLSVPYINSCATDPTATIPSHESVLAIFNNIKGTITQIPEVCVTTPSIIPPQDTRCEKSISGYNCRNRPARDGRLLGDIYNTDKLFCKNICDCNKDCDGFLFNNNNNKCSLHNKHFKREYSSCTRPRTGRDCREPDAPNRNNNYNYEFYYKHKDDQEPWTMPVVNEQPCREGEYQDTTTNPPNCRQCSTCPGGFEERCPCTPFSNTICGDPEDQSSFFKGCPGVTDEGPPIIIDGEFDLGEVDLGEPDEGVFGQTGVESPLSYNSYNSDNSDE